MTDPAQTPGISVVADGEASVSPDLALVSLTVSASGKELAPTRDEVNTRTSAVLAFVRDAGVAKADLNAPDVQIQPEYDYRRGQKLTGYRVARQVTIRVRELDQLGPILDGVVSAGANEVQGAQMSAADPSLAEHEALRNAVAAARAKAEVIATAAGVKVGNVLRIEEEPDFGGPPMPKMRMAMAADAVQTEVATGDLTVTRRVRATFRLA